MTKKEKIIGTIKKLYENASVLGKNSGVHNGFYEGEAYAYYRVFQILTDDSYLNLVYNILSEEGGQE